MVMIDVLAPFQRGKYTGVGFGRLHLARSGGLLRLMNELFFSREASILCYLRERWLPSSPPLPHQCSGSQEPAGGGGALSSERTHRHAHARTRPPRDRGGRCALSFLAALPSPPPLFKSCSRSFLLSFMCAVLLIQELGKRFRGPPAGRRTAGLRSRAERTRGQLGFVLPLAGVPGRKSLCGAGAHRCIGGLTPAPPHPPPKLEREILSGGHSALGPGGAHRPGEGLLVHKWLSPYRQMCSVIMVAPVARGPWGAPWAGREKGPGAGAPRGAARRRRRVGPSGLCRLPSRTASTEPGRPLAFHYRAYESSSPGKYVAIKINRPALSAEHNANYLWAVCAIFIIVQAPGASRLPASPARPGPLRAKLRAGCSGQGALGTQMGFQGRGRALACLTLQVESLTLVSGTHSTFVGGLLRAKLGGLRN